MIGVELFACARCKKDIQTTVAFLTTRFREPDEDDWKKLRRLLEYLRGTIKLGMFLRADSLNVIKWWVDASYAIHPDMKVHTGANMSLGGGSAISMSKKHKLNECSSTGAEVIGVDDVMLQMLWTKYFCEEQGYPIEENIMYQDNLSAMMLDTNSNKSSSKSRKNIRVRYVFIKDRVSSGDIKLEYCPTEEMLADHFTKPL